MNTNLRSTTVCPSGAAVTVLILGLAGAGLLSAVGCAPQWGYSDREIYCCGQQGVFVLNMDQAQKDPTARVWTWTPADSPEIPVEHQIWFRAMDECKPVMGGQAVLVCSSSNGGVAVIRRSDKKCLFYAGGKGVHSAEVLPGFATAEPGDLLAVALSTPFNQVRLYKLALGEMAAKPLYAMKLPGAHGVVWDRQRRVLWALGTDSLLRLVVDPVKFLEVVGQYPLPRRGGHDLSPIGERTLAVTVWEGVYQFDAEKETFSPLPALAERAGMKSVSRHPKTGQFIFVQAHQQSRPVDGGQAEQDDDRGAAIGTLDGQTVRLAPTLIYKARWNASHSLGK